MTETVFVPAASGLAVWAITPGGLALAEKMRRQLDDCTLLTSQALPGQEADQSFARLSDAVEHHFHRFAGHIFVMSAGIVVRLIAAHLRHKTIDPAVVVVDETGQFAISLLSGHLGGANELARRVADITGGTPVITTATDVNFLPSIDLIAQQQQLIIENPNAIKTVNMALLQGRAVRLHDPYHFMSGRLPGELTARDDQTDADLPLIVVDDRRVAAVGPALFLRPPLLCAGIGCNRGTPATEIRELLMNVLDQYGLARHSLACLATIDIKQDETGILDLAEKLHLPVHFYDSTALDGVNTVENPSPAAKQYTGASSVCEAAAILAANSGTLIVPKQKAPNVTVALARRSATFLSSAWGRGTPTT